MSSYLVAGCGRVGSGLAIALSLQGHQVAVIVRQAEVVLPRGATRLLAGDQLIVLVDEDYTNDVRSLFEDGAPTATVGPETT